jgi:regulator of RNase E activity RraA
MTAGAQARNASGVVISGRCRDIAEHRAANFPVFARAQSTLGQSSFTRPSGVNVPLVITGDLGDELAVHVQPGDWIIADEDGVVCVPKTLEGSVAELAAKGKQIDALCLEDIKAGKGVQASFKKHRGK